MKLEERISARMDNSYLEYVSLCRVDECLGADFKLENNIFKQPELEAHKQAAAKLGEHRAYANVLRMMSEAADETNN